MRRALFAVLALLPCVAPLAVRADAIDDKAALCYNGTGDDVRWAEVCKAAIKSGRITDPSRLSVFYSQLGFAEINRALATDRNFDQALADLNQALRLDPDDIYAINNRANAYLYRGEYARALADLDIVLRRDPGRSMAHTLRCIALTKLFRAREGLPECLAAIEAGVDHPQAYLALGEAYEGTGDMRAAATAFRHALALDPDFQDAQIGLDRVTGKPTS